VVMTIKHVHSVRPFASAYLLFRLIDVNCERKRTAAVKRSQAARRETFAKLRIFLAVVCQLVSVLPHISVTDLRVKGPCRRTERGLTQRIRIAPPAHFGVDTNDSLCGSIVEAGTIHGPLQP